MKKQIFHFYYYLLTIAVLSCAINAAGSTPVAQTVGVQFPGYYGQPVDLLNTQNPNWGNYTAGVVPQQYWNVACNTTGAGDGVITSPVTNAALITGSDLPTSNLIDSTGSSSAVQFSLSNVTNNRFTAVASDFPNPVFYEPGGSCDQYLAMGIDYSTNSNTPATLTLSNLNVGDTYNLIVYVGSANYYGAVNVSVNLGSTTYYLKTDASNSVTGWTQSTYTSGTFGAPTANYVEFMGIPGAALSSETLTVNGAGSGLCGFQLIETGSGVSGGTLAAPTGLAATAGNAQVSLSWTSGTGAVSYNVYRGASAGGESATPIATGIYTNSYTDTGLSNGTTYYYKVAAVNASGTSAYSNETAATPSATIFALVVNSGSGSGNYNTGTVVTVTANAPATGWQFAGWTGATGALANPTAATTTLTMPAANTSITATYSVIPPVPSAPTGLGAAAGNAQVSLGWTSGTAATSYNIYRGTTAGREGATPIATGVTTESYLDTELANGTTYYYTVVSVNISGTSGYSNEADATASVTANTTPKAQTVGVQFPMYYGQPVNMLNAQNSIGSNYTAGAVPQQFWNVASNATGAGNGIIASPVTNAALIAGNGLPTGNLLDSTGSSSTVRFSLGNVTNEDQGNNAGGFPDPIWYLAGGLCDQYLAQGVDFSTNSNTPATLTLGNLNAADSYDLIVYVGSAFYYEAVNVSVNLGSTTYYLQTDGSSSLTGWTLSTYTSGTFGAPTANYVEFRGIPGAALNAESVKVNGAGSGLCGFQLIESGSGLSGGIPSAPTGLGATAGNSLVSLSWTSGSGAVSYNVYRGTSTGGEGTTPIATGIYDTDFTDMGLINGTTYYYTVAAVNASGTSAYSNETSAAPSAALFTLTVNNGTGGGYYNTGTVITVTANAPATGWQFAGWTGATGALANPAAATSTLTMPAANTSITATYSVIPPVPSAPTGLGAAAGNAQVSLGWTSGTAAKSYNIYRGTAAGGEGTTPIATGVTTVSYLDTGLTNGTTYYYTVVSVNISGTSGYSNEADATAGATPTAQTIGVQFPLYYGQPANILNTQNPFGDNYTAGAVPQQYWNVASNATGAGNGVIASPVTNAALIAGNGLPTGNLIDSKGSSSAVQFSLGNVTNNFNTASSSGFPYPVWYAPGGFCDQYLAQGVDISYNSATPATLTLNNLNAGDTYNLIVYVGSAFYYGAVNVSVTLGITTYYLKTDGSNSLSSWTRSTYTSGTSGAPTANYVEFDGVSGAVLNSESLTVNGVGSGLSGFQLVDSGGALGGGAPATPTGLGATSGTGVGQISLSWSPSSGAQSYVLQRSTVPNGGYTALAMVTAPASTSSTTNKAAAMRTNQMSTPASITFTYSEPADEPGYYYEVVAVNASGMSTSSSTAFAAPNVPSTFDGWVYTYFGLNPPSSEAGETANPSNDGLPNLLKYALDLNPLTPTTSPVTFTQTGGTCQFTYQRPANRTDISYAVQASPDLSNWTSSGVTLTEITTGDPETWQATCTPAPGSNIFFRLQITRP